MAKDRNAFTFFKSAGNTKRNAHLDWQGRYARYGLAEGFKEAGDRVIESTISDPRHPDIFFQPIAFLYRHYLELQLKNIIGLAMKLTNQESSKPVVGHDLRKLWSISRPLLIQIWPEGDPSELRPVDIAIEEFGDLDSDGQSFRYIEDVRGAPTLVDAPRIVSLENLRSQMQEVYAMLSGCEMGISYFLDLKSDMEHWFS